MVERVNRDIKKFLQANRLEESDGWQDASQNEFLVMHRSTPNKTTGKSPFEMMFGRKMRDKILSVREAAESEADREVRTKEEDEKRKNKERGDAKRRAHESEIVEGEKVFLKNQPGHKLKPNFKPEKYTVISAKGGDYVVKSDVSGVVKRRHVTSLKIIPSSDPSTSVGVSSSDLSTKAGPSGSSATAPSTSTLSSPAPTISATPSSPPAQMSGSVLSLSSALDAPETPGRSERKKRAVKEVQR